MSDIMLHSAKKCKESDEKSESYTPNGKSFHPNGYISVLFPYNLEFIWNLKLIVRIKSTKIQNKTVINKIKRVLNNSLNLKNDP